MDSLTDEQKLLLPKFQSKNFENALAFHLEMIEKKDTVDLERQTREAELDRRISELDAKIVAVYDSYGVGRNQSSEQQK
jgi:hypothetical protein